MNLPILVRPLAWRHARRMVEQWHYLGYAPPGAKVSLGVYNDDGLLGALIFGRPVARLEDQTGTLELTRMVLVPGCPKNSASRALSLAEKWIAKHRSEKRLIAYADSAQGHHGSIYRAANWKCLGLRPTRPWNRSRSNRRGLIGGRKTKFVKERAAP